MSTKSSTDDVLGESWVEVGSTSNCSQGTGTATPASVTQQLTVEDYLRLLREAQRESNQSSARDSLAGSRRDSPRSSPKSPPNSPVQTGTPITLDWHSYYMNTEAKEDNFPFVYNDWSSRPDQLPPKMWCFRTPKKDLLSLRCAKLGDTSMFSRKGLCAVVLSNLLSLLIGTGLGFFLNKYGYLPVIRIR